MLVAPRSVLIIVLAGRFVKRRLVSGESSLKLIIPKMGDLDRL